MDVRRACDILGVQSRLVGPTSLLSRDFMLVDAVASHLGVWRLVSSLSLPFFLFEKTSLLSFSSSLPSSLSL
jgi:hypothetical protein